MSDPRRRIATAAIHQPFVTYGLVALDYAAEEAVKLRLGIDHRVEVLGPADHHFAPNYRLNSVTCIAIARKNPLTGKAKRYDLPAAGAIGLELREYSGRNEHHFIAGSAWFAERAARIGVDSAMRHLLNQFGKALVETGGG